MPRALSGPLRAEPRQPLPSAAGSHEEAAALVVEAEIVDAQHAHAEADLRADRVERRVERFFGDAEVGDAHRHDAVLAPDEQRSGASIGAISSVPELARLLRWSTAALVG